MNKPKKPLPEFANEQEEGRWYKAHRDELDDYFEPLSEEEEKEFSEMLATLFPQKKVLNVEHFYQNQTVEEVFERTKRNWRG